MLLPILLSSTIIATTTIRTSVSAQGGSSASVSVTQEINAQSSRTISQSTRQEIRREVTGEAQKTIVQNRCERVTERVNNHTRAGESVKDRRARIHQGVVTRLNNLFAKLAEKGCDTSNAKANLATWETMITSYRDHFNSWLDSLHDLQGQVCQENAADYKAQLQTIHDQRKLAQDEKRKISQYYVNTLKPSVRQLRASCQVSPSPEASQ